MGFVNPTEFDPGSGGGADNGVGWILLPFYVITTLDGLETSGAVNPKYPFNTDIKSFSTLTRALLASPNTPYLQIHYTNGVVESKWEGYREAVVIETPNGFTESDPRFNRINYLVGDTPATDQGIGGLYGDGELSAVPPNDNYLEWTPVEDEDLDKISLIVTNIVESPIDIKHRFSIMRDTDPAPAGDKNLYTIFHGVLIPLPQDHNSEIRGEEYKYHGSKINIGPSGREKWTGLATNGPKRKKDFRWIALGETDKDLLLDIFEALHGGLPVWYFENLDDKDTWFQARIAQNDERENNHGSFEVAWTMEEM